MDEKTVLFRVESFERKFTAVLEVPNAREYWGVYFDVDGEGPTIKFSVPTPLGQIKINFTAQLLYFEYQDVEPMLGEFVYFGFRLRLKCQEASHPGFKNLRGKLMVEFMNWQNMPYQTFEFSMEEFSPVLRHEKHHDFDLDKTSKEEALQGNNLRAGDCLTMRLTFTFVETRIGAGKDLRA